MTTPAGFPPCDRSKPSSLPAARSGRPRTDGCRAQTTAAKNKVVLQVSDNDPAKWALALSNVSNIQAGVGAENVDMEIVADGPGISMLRGGSPVAQRITAALKSGVKVVACQNTMNAQHRASRHAGRHRLRAFGGG